MFRSILRPFARAILVTVLAVVIHHQGADALDLVSDEQKLSYMGGPSDDTLDARIPKVAFNPTQNEYLVVWEGVSTADSNQQIYGVRVDAATSLPIDPVMGTPEVEATQISAMSSMGRAPAVAYNTTENEYFVVWSGEDDQNPVEQVYGARLDGATGQVSAADIQISFASSLARFPELAFNPTRNEYLVIFDALDSIAPVGAEVFAMRVDGATGQPIDPSPTATPGTIESTLISQMDFGPNFRDLAFNSVANEYLVTWSALHGDETGSQVYGARVDAATGAPIDEDPGTAALDAIQYSFMSSRGEQNAMAFNPARNEHLVAWFGKDDADPNFQVYGVRVDGTTAQLIDPVGGTAAIEATQISFMSRIASVPAVSLDPIAGEFILSWAGGHGSVSTNQIYAGRVDAATGLPVDPDPTTAGVIEPVRVSDLGIGGFSSATAFNPAAETALITWHGSDTLAGKEEVFGRLVAGPPVADLSLSLSADPTTIVEEAETTELSLRLTNAGPEAIDGATVTLTYAAELLFSTATGDGALSGDGQTWTVGALAAGGAFAEITITLFAKLAGDPATVLAEITDGAGGDPDISNNTANVDVTVEPNTPAMEVTVSPAAVAGISGRPASFSPTGTTYSITNTGNVALTSLGLQSIEARNDGTGNPASLVASAAPSPDSLAVGADSGDLALSFDSGFLAGLVPGSYDFTITMTVSSSETVAQTSAAVTVEVDAAQFSLSFDSGNPGYVAPLPSGGSTLLPIDLVNNLGGTTTFAWASDCTTADDFASPPSDPVLPDDGAFDDATAEDPTFTAPVNATDINHTCSVSVTATNEPSGEQASLTRNLLVVPETSAGGDAPVLRLAVSPAGRAAQTNGDPVTAFGVILNRAFTAPGDAINCVLEMRDEASAPFAGTLRFTPYDPLADGGAGLVTGESNTPIPVPGVIVGESGGLQIFLLALTTDTDVLPQEFPLSPVCDNWTFQDTQQISGLNTFIFSAQASLPVDVLASNTILTPATDNGAFLRVEGLNGQGQWLVRALNLATVSGNVTVSPTTVPPSGGVPLDATVSICRLGDGLPIAENCMMAPAPSVTTNLPVLGGGPFQRFLVFVDGNGVAIPRDPATNRLIVRFEEDGDLRTINSVALEVLE